MEPAEKRAHALGRGPTALVAVVALICTVAGCSTVPRGLAPIHPQLVTLDLRQASFEGQQFHIALALANPNEVEIPVRRVAFDVRLAGQGLLAGESMSPFTLPAGGRETVELTVFSETVSSVSRLMSLAQGPQNELDYELQGQLTLDARLRDPVPIASRGRVPLTVNGGSP